MQSRLSTQVLNVDLMGVTELTPEELVVVSGGGVIAAGCLVAAGGATIAIVGVIVGVAVYAFLSD